MNTINSNLGFIIFFAFIVWVFIANDFYLKLFFLKGNKKKRRNQQQENSDNEFFEQAYAGRNVPQYIKDVIVKSQDRHELLSLYLASRSLINIKVFKLIMGSNTNDYEKTYVDYYSSKVGNKIYLVFCALRWVAFLGLSIIFGCFWNDLSETFIHDNKEINYHYYYIFLSLIFVLLMPYGIYFKKPSLNKFFSIGVFIASIIFAVINVHGMLLIFSHLLLSDFYIVTFISFLLIIIGAYAFMGYTKFIYMANFFELLKVNLAENSNVDQSVPLPNVTDPSQVTSS